MGASIFLVRSRRNEEFMNRGPKKIMSANLVLIGPVVSEEMTKLYDVNDNG